MATGWTILMAPVGLPWVIYDSYVDFNFIDHLYDYGAATIALTALDGNPAPQPGWVIKIVWDYAEATEQDHWRGFITQADLKQEGNLYAIRALTLDAILHIAQTGDIRDYLAATPYDIIQGAFPNLLINSQGNNVITYGAAAGVPNKIDAVTPGVISGVLANDRFVADSTTLLNNIKRLCLQSRYGDGSYGLQWTTTLEGANGTNPRFYLVKRRERAAAYTPEVFVAPDDFVNMNRGNSLFQGIDAVKVIGAGDGRSRVESLTAGTGTREYVAFDKSIMPAVTGTPSSSPNADNMAIRLEQIYATSIEIIQGEHLRHASPTRAGDLITVTQGASNVTLPVLQRIYSLSNKTWAYHCGRPSPGQRAFGMSMRSHQGADASTPQLTDLIVPSQFPSGLNTITIPLGAAGPLAIPAGTQIVSAAIPVPGTFSGDCEGSYEVALIDIDPAHTPRNGGPITLQAQFEFSSNPGSWFAFNIHHFGEPALGSGVAPATAAFNDQYRQTRTYPFKINHPVSGDTVITQARLVLINHGKAILNVIDLNTQVGVFLRPKHRHNEL